MRLEDGEWLERHSRLLMDSYLNLTGKSLIDANLEPRAAELLYEAPFALLSHGTEADPVLNYGNRTALSLWEMSWKTFTGMPSRLTAEPLEQSVREAFMENVRQKRIFRRIRRRQNLGQRQEVPYRASRGLEPH
ncbi:MEKHLA domain-containing protein [Cohnella ginsengisoli]|uniref:MEKHLA domain-containing protein n=1 Tax=Cohnella ginsengisoli TaxID=425004 RepID=UPI003B8A73F7